MKIDNLLNLNTREELREWLKENHRNESCCWIPVSLTSKPNTLLYLDAVEEALCFGWIDGIKKKISEDQLAQRLSPRVQKSSWTELNKERVRRLEKLGLMTDAGRKVLPEMNREAFVIDPSIYQRLKEDQVVYDNFMGFPELYRRIRIDTIQREYKDKELFERRLEKFINHTRENQMYGDWHDGGRLLD
jgi:uncharacterized protein YdeI (YjbR/CyaY-like superfamily)